MAYDLAIFCEYIHFILGLESAWPAARPGVMQSAIASRIALHDIT